MKEIVNVFVTRAQLMPADETPEEHGKLRAEEAALVERDKTNTDARAGGLFRGCFRAMPRIVHTIRDREDGVERCPFCNWEVEDGMCGRCEMFFDQDGVLMSDASDSPVYDSGEGFSSDEELDEEVDLADDETAMGFGSSTAGVPSAATSTDGA